MRASTILWTLGVAAVLAAGATAAGFMLEMDDAQAGSRPEQNAGTNRATPPAAAKAQAPTQVAVAQPPASQPEPSSWVSRCASATRQSAPECFIEQTVVLTKTGQLIASVTVRLPPTTNKPVMMVQTPVGLYLPAGIALQIDEAPPLRLVVQTCDTKGCYAGDQISPQLLETMKAGKRLSVIFQNLEKKDISVPLTLAQFAEAYQRIQ